MIFALNLDPETGRCLSATEDQFGAENQPRVEFLPDGDLYDYLFVDGGFVYSPPPPELPRAERDVPAGSVFSLGGNYYRAVMPIPRGEPVTRFNTEPVSILDIVNALEAARKGE